MAAPRAIEGWLSGPGYLDEIRLEDLHVLSLQAQYRNLVQPAQLQPVPQLHVNTPYSSSRPCPPMERDPCIDRLVLVEKRMVFRADCVEVAHDDPATASGLAQDTSQHLYL